MNRAFWIEQSVYKTVSLKIRLIWLKNIEDLQDLGQVSTHLPEDENCLVLLKYTDSCDQTQTT